jgi:hypothetical protein
LFSELQGYEKVITLIQSVSGRGAARLAHLLGVQGVAGSNPAVPTNSEIVDCSLLNIRKTISNEGSRVLSQRLMRLWRKIPFTRRNKMKAGRPDK